MNVELVRIELDDRAWAYVLDELDDGMILGAALKPVVQATTGEVFTRLPRDMTLERAHEFHRGGVLPARPERYPTEGGYLVPVDSVMSARDDRVVGFLGNDLRACCIIGEMNPRPGDPNPPTEPSVFWIGEECYHWLGANASPELVEDTFAAAELPWHAVAACYLPETPTKKEDLDRSALISLARSVSEISVRAYDGEGFVIWRRA